jgi:Cft2 family RNA processing exonuclease
MKVLWDNGICIQNNEFKLMLDSGRAPFVGISHGHSDHTVNSKEALILTHQTAELLPKRCKFYEMAYGEKLQLDSTSITLHDASHVLGSCQFEIEANGHSVCYTGDFRLRKSLFFKGSKPQECDTLVIESTYGLPCYSFPDFFDVCDEIKKWVANNEGKNIVFGAYRLGKAQEIIGILNEMGIAPVVHPSISKICEAYVKNKIKLDYALPSANEKLSTFIIPTTLMDKNFLSALSAQTGRKTLSGLATGWGCGDANKIFKLSDHADFKQLMEYVEQANPKKIYTVHGYDAELAKEIKSRLNIDAAPLRGLMIRLTDFFANL